MKAKHNPLSSRFTGYHPLLISGLIASFPFAANAADLFWDGADTGADAQGGTGTWLNGTTANWDTLATGGADTVWTNANLDNAIFGGTAGTVTLGSDVTASKLGFTTANYVIEPSASSYKIVLGAAADNTTNDATLQHIYGNLTKTINANIDNAGFLFVVGSGTTNLNGIISGSGGLSKVGGGTLTLSDNNTYTGKTFIEAYNVSGSTVNVSSFNSVVGGTASSSLGAPTSAADGTIQIGTGKRASTTLNYQGAAATGETTDRILDFQFNSSAVHTINASGSDLLQFTSATTSNANGLNQTGGLTLGGTGSGEFTQALAALPFATNSAGLLKKDAGTWTINGSAADIYKVAVTGGTLINNGEINVTTSVAVSNSATLTAGYIIANSASLGAATSTIMQLGGTTLGTGYDNITLEAAGALVYGGNLNILNDGAYDMDASSFTYDLFAFDTMTPTGTFASVTVNGETLTNSGGLWTESIGDVTYAFSQSTGDLTITVVPEPSAALLGGLGLLALLRRRR